MSEYKVGDPDPTPDDEDEPCVAAYMTEIGFPVFCTWEKHGPEKKHVAGTGDEIVAVW